MSKEPSEEMLTKISELVNQLSSKDASERIEACNELVMIGAAAVPAVAELADSPRDHTRWECAKILAEIADVSSVDTLIRLLEDSDPGARWDAALGLITIGKPAVAPLLRALVHHSVDFTIIAGARHVMHEYCNNEWGEVLRPVYQELNSFEARTSAPVAAHLALQQWEQIDGGTTG